MLPQHPARGGDASFPRVLILHRTVDRDGVLHLPFANDMAGLDRRLQRLLEDLAVDITAADLLWSFQSRRKSRSTFLDFFSPTPVPDF